MRRFLLAFIAVAALWVAPSGFVRAAAPTIAIVAAENFYGDVAAQIGGPDVTVISIMSNPGQDPHAFEASPATARALAAADLVIFNGADYDPWVNKLIAVSPAAHRDTIVVADLMHKAAGDNPHLWYDPATMPALAAKLADAFAARDPAHADAYRQRLKSFLASLAPIDRDIAEIKAKYAGTPVTATEPVFGYMAQALGFVMRNQRFQLAVMNDTEPSARDLAAMEADLRNRSVKLLLYNSQVSDNLTERLRAIAQSAKVPVVGVAETEPPGQTYQQWITAELAAVSTALADGGI